MQWLVELFSIVRWLIACVVIVFMTPLTSIAVIVCSYLKLHEVSSAFIRHWGRTVLLLFGVRVKCEGLENIPKNEGYLVLFNHQSHLDIPVVTKIIHGRLRFGAKIELFKIPFFGPAMKASGMLPIHRGNRSETLRIYEAVQERFHQGWCYALAPEGRRHDVDEIAPFKKGPFLFAMNGRTQVLPVVIRGNLVIYSRPQKLVNRGRFFRTTYVKVLPPISAKDWQPENLDEQVQKVRDVFIKTYSTLPIPR